VSSTPIIKQSDFIVREEFYKYVPHHQQKLWESLGWTFHCDLGPPHAAYSSLYKWEGSGKPVVPNTPVQISNKDVKETSDE
jgi:hypothetical protein